MLLSIFYDAWLYLWYLDYYNLLFCYKATLTLEVPTNTDNPPSVPEDLKNKFSEESASTSLKKTAYYGGTIVVVYLGLIIIGMVAGFC